MNIYVSPFNDLERKHTKITITYKAGSYNHSPIVKTIESSSRSNSLVNLPGILPS